MDNKQIFAVAGDITRALMNGKIITGKARDIKQAIFESIQPTLEEIHTAQGTEEEKKEDGSDLARKLSQDPDYARGWMIKQLAEASKSGNTQASKELRDILQIASRKDELRIEVIDYANTIVNCPHCSTNIHAPSSCLQRVDT